MKKKKIKETKETTNIKFKFAVETPVEVNLGVAGGFIGYIGNASTNGKFNFYDIYVFPTVINFESDDVICLDGVPEYRISVFVNKPCEECGGNCGNLLPVIENRQDKKRREKKEKEKKIKPPNFRIVK